MTLSAPIGSDLAPGSAQNFLHERVSGREELDLACG